MCTFPEAAVCVCARVMYGCVCPGECLEQRGGAGEGIARGLEPRVPKAYLRFPGCAVVRGRGAQRVRRHALEGLRGVSGSGHVVEGLERRGAEEGVRLCDVGPSSVCVCVCVCVWGWVGSCGAEVFAGVGAGHCLRHPGRSGRAVCAFGTDSESGAADVASHARVGVRPRLGAGLLCVLVAQRLWPAR